jgi:Carboxypeptidase regulatory-like domain
VTVRAGKTTEVRLATEARTGVIRGTVVGSDGAPVTAAFVTAISGYELDDASVSTGTGGGFELRLLRPRGRYSLTAHRTGGGGSATVHDVNAGDTVQIQLRSMGTIEGTVVGAPDPVTLAEGEHKRGVTLTIAGEPQQRP